jgi:HEPN domain-containing protein
MDEAAAEWLTFSDMDYKAARHLYDNMRPIPSEIVCYHCQQSAEKALKAFLIYSGIKPERTHDLEALRDKCEGVDASFNEIIENCERLTRYASQSRYPFEIEITNSDTFLALQDSEKINDFIKVKII